MLNIISLDGNVDVLFLSALYLINIVRLLLMKAICVGTLHDSGLVKTTLKRYMMMNIGWLRATSSPDASVRLTTTRPLMNLMTLLSRLLLD